jgi:hypothetical protein
MVIEERDVTRPEGKFGKNRYGEVEPYTKKAEEEGDGFEHDYISGSISEPLPKFYWPAPGRYFFGSTG